MFGNSTVVPVLLERWHHTVRSKLSPIQYDKCVYEKGKFKLRHTCGYTHTHRKHNLKQKDPHQRDLHTSQRIQNIDHKPPEAEREAWGADLFPGTFGGGMALLIP